MRHHFIWGLGCALALVFWGCDDGDTDPADAGATRDSGVDRDAGPPDSGPTDGGIDLGPCALDDGQCIFRHDTFGDEQLWTDVLRLNELVQGLPPTTALSVGLKVDAEAVPSEVLAGADLEDPATTVALLSLDAVVGVRASVEDGMVTRIGITCALCHSTVDDSVAAGIGSRLDGWPNRDLNPGAIIALSPGLPALAESLGVETEAARAARDYAQDKLGWQTAISLVNPENVASARVAMRVEAWLEGAIDHPRLGHLDLYRHPGPSWDNTDTLAPKGAA